MARLLIKAVDATSPDPAKDKAGCYKLGDIVVIRDDSHEWSPSEGLPAFLQLDIVGDPEQVQFLEATENEQGADLTTPAIRKILGLSNKIIRINERKTLRRRQYQVDLTGVVFAEGKATLANPTYINKRLP